ncbi:MAG: Fic family protein [Anaerolineaceae bacterium]|jgi:Fic family protein|nr:Fic family protein [Anaerolineaceae bacterium]
MDSKAFQNSPNGKLVPTRIDLVPYLAFVPNPLPPTIEASWRLSNLTSQADRALSELAGIGRNLPNPNLLIRPFMQREAVLSSMIEGTQTEMADLLAYQLREAPLPGFEDAHASEADNREVLNYVHSLEYGIKVVKEREIDEALLLELHRQLLDGVRGNYATPGRMREEQNYIGRSRNPEEASYVPPPVIEMRWCMNDLIHYLNSKDDYPPLIRLAMVHYQFEAVHPFRDGNGRIGRLLISLLLSRWGLMPSPLLYLSAYFEATRQQYYELLLGISQRGEWQAWLEYFLRGVEEQATDALKRGKELMDLREEWRARLGERRVSKTAERLCDLLFEIPIVTIPEVQKRLGYKDYNSAKKAVQQLVTEGILSQSSPGDYERSFKAPRILEIVT